MPWTVQKLIDDDMQVTAHCHNAACNHHAEVSLSLLRDKLGPDARLMAADLIPKLRCSKCGGKTLGLIYSPAGNKHRVPGPNLYQTRKEGR